MIGRERPGEQSEVAQLIQQTLEQERWQREMMEQRYAQYGEDDEEVGTAGPAGGIIAPWWLDGALQPSSVPAFPGLVKKAGTHQSLSWGSPQTEGGHADPSFKEHLVFWKGSHFLSSETLPAPTGKTQFLQRVPTLRGRHT